MNFIINLLKKFEGHINVVKVVSGLIIGIPAVYFALNKEFNFFKKKNDFIIDAQLASYSDSIVQKTIPDTNYLTTYYQEKGEDDTLLIKVNSDYTSQFFNHQFLSVPFVAEAGVPDFTVHFPILDVKLINNTAKTIILNKILLNVKSSRIDKRPLLYLVTYSDELFNFMIRNEGWSKWQSCTIKFNIGSKPDSTNQTYKYSLEFPYFKDYRKVNLEKFLLAEGLNIPLFKKAEKNKIYPWDKNIYYFKNALSNYVYVEKSSGGDRTYFTRMNGELSIQPDNYKIKFTAKIPLTIPEGLGGALDIYGDYNLKLNDSAENYTVTYPISISLQPNEPGRFFLTLAANESSFHTFTLSLDNINQKTIESDPIKLDLFLPKTSAQLLSTAEHSRKK